MEIEGEMSASGSSGGGGDGVALSVRDRVVESPIESITFLLVTSSAAGAS